MRQLFVTALVLSLGAMFTWFTATILEQYALSDHRTAQMESGTPNVAAQKMVSEQRMF